MNKLVTLNTKTPVVFNVEKVKLNKLPRHFSDEDRENKLMSIDGKKVKVMINRDRTQYVAFSLEEPTKDNPKFVQHYYVRDHKFFDANEVATYVKPKAEAKPAAAEEAKSEPTK